MGAVLDAVPEDVDDAPVLDLPVETLEKLTAGVVAGVQMEAWAVSGWVPFRKAARWARSTQAAGL